MDDWRLWQEMARESEEAAGLAENARCLRSAASRYYYAAYQAATALLLYRGLMPPLGREAWSHMDTPLLVRAQLQPLIRSHDKRSDLALRLVNLYELRIRADYAGWQPPIPMEIRKAGRDSRHVLRIADDILPQK